MVVSGCLCYWIVTSVLLLSSSRQCSGTTMTFTTQPFNISIDRGGDVSFSCTYPNVGVNISWNGPGVEAGDGICTTSTETNAKTCTLMITNVNNSRTGNYFCTARFKNGTMVNSTAGSLSVNYMTVRFESNVIIASENQPIEVPVNVTVFGSPVCNPYLLLHYGDSEAATSMNISIAKINETQIFQIPTIQLTCMTSPVLVTATTDDPLVELQGSNTVSIHIVPAIGFNKSSYSVVEGDTVRVCVTVMCGRLMQDETVMLSIIDNTARAGIDFIAPEQMNITLTTSSESDCVMIMTIFDDYQTSMDKQFQILMQPSASTEPDTEPDSPVYMPSTTNITITNLPLPTIMPLEKKVSTGGTTGYQVNTNFTVTKFQWLHNNTNITNGEMRYSGIKTNNLTVMNIVRGDAGNYSCNVTTEFGLTVTSQQAQLQVFAIPMITAEPVNITVNRSEAGLVSFSVTIDEALGEEFTYQWLRNGLALIEMPEKIEGVNTSVLMIMDARNEDEGSYQCVIVNGAGDNVTSDKAFLSVVDLPVMPVITNVSASSTSITINWNQNLSSDVFWYELRYSFTIEECYSENNASKWLDMINGSLTSYTLTNSSETPVEEDSAYSIFLTAVNSDGRSEASTTEISTLGAVPTGAPINLNQMVVNDRAITIQWESVECSQRNGEIIGYNVTYHPAGDNSMLKSVVIHASDGTFTAMGLIFDTMYAFEVQAINSYGIGPPANANVRTSTLQGIVIVYDGRSYQNNSIVNLDAEGGVLQCFTNKSSCCRVPNREGEWRNPNGTMVQIRGTNGDFYRTRGNNPGVINLTWSENAVIPQGVFCCETPRAPSQFACIGVYPEGAGFPMVVSITVDFNTAPPALVCTSTGGPATTVIWKVNNQIINGSPYQQRQRIASHQNATFQNILRIPIDSIADYNATYECLVMNSVGNDSLSFRLEAIEIVSGNLSIGDSGSLLCKSIITVDVIEWLNNNGEVIASLTNTKRLNLTFAPVNTSINNQMYTCRVNKSASVNKTITVSVTVENPLEVMIGGPSSMVVIGERATINCTATTIAGVSQLPTLTLTHPNGINLSRIVGKMSSIILDPVEVEDAGEYTCMGEIDLENITSAIVQVEQNITFKLSTPMIDVAYNESSLKVGSSTDLNCTVTNYSITDIDVLINITWSRSGIVLSNDSDRVVISNVHELLSASTSQLTLSPLSANDENITCSVNVYLATPNSFMEMTPTVSKQVQLTIEEPDVVVEITSTFEGHNVSAGTNFSLTCIVGGIENLMAELIFEWIRFNGIDFEEINVTSNEIHFLPLKLSEAGNYMCQVSVRSSLLRSDLSFVSMPPYTIRAIVPIPIVTAILPNQDIFVGSSPSVTCIAEFDESVDLPLNIIIMYTFGQTIINSIHSVHMENYMRYTRTFTIDKIQANQMGVCSFQSLYSGLELSEFILDNQMDTIFVIVYIPINAVITTEITSSGENIVGEKYNLTCTVVINGTHDTPRVNITWNSTISAGTISYDNGTYISVLQFDPLQEFHHDRYQCSVAVADIVKDKQFYLSVQVPIVNATINGSEDIPVVGQPYTLTCTVSGDEKLDSNISYHWTQNNGTETELEANCADLSFSSLTLSNSGTYSCISVVSSMYLSDVIISVSNLLDIQLQAPSPASITITVPPYIIFTGRMFNISCIVNLPPTVDIPVTVNIVWSEPIQNYTSPAPTMERPNEYSSTATFVLDVEWESVSFQCAANVDSDSPFITASESRAANMSVLVVGRPSQPTGLSTSVDSTNVELTWSTRDGDVIHGYELQYDYHIRQCPSNTPGMMRSIDISNSTTSYTLENLEEDSEFNISLTAFNPAGRSEPANVLVTTLISAPSGAPLGLNITHFDFTNVTIEWNPVECSERNGEIDGYRLIYYPTMNSSDNESISIDGSNTNTYIVVGLQPRVDYTLTLGAVGGNYTLFGPESSRMVQTLVPPGIGVLFHGKVYGNNSIVSLRDIGEGRKALLCVTSETGCCRVASVPTEMRKWYFPNGLAVSIKAAGHSFYRNRDPSIVRLNRRYNATSPNGIFLCIIPSSTTPLMTSTIHIGIYDIGQGIPQISSFTFNRTSKSLNCTSLDGPVTTVTWKINNQRLEIDGNRYQQTQVIVDSETAEYANILYSNDVSNLVGVFTCIVQNARGSNNKTISTNGVVIENIAETYTVGSDANITCHSDTDTERMEWLTQEGTQSIMIVSESNVTQLNLTFTPISDSVHGQVYICRAVRNNSDTPEQNFTMNVEVPAAEMVLELDIVPMRNTGIAGESISFLCIVTKTISGLEHQPLAVWLENGTTLTEQSESNVNLTFNKLNTFHGKVYTCQGTLRSSALGTPLVVMKNHSLIVQIPTPSINVTLSSSTAYAGTNLSVICDISINTAVDSNISVNVTWFNGSAPISTETERVSVLPLTGSKLSYTSNLLIHPLIDVDNTSNFSCQASVHSDSAFIEQSNVGEGSTHIPVQQRNNESGTETTMATAPATTTSTSTTDEIVTAMTMSTTDASDDTDINDDLLLQLRLFEVQNCLEWVNVNTNIKVNDISIAIVSNINQRCQCGLSLENVTNGVFRCFPASPQAVTFRAVLHGGTKASSSELSSYIELWIRNDITIPIQSILINVDSSCMVAISSFDDGECQIDSEKHTNNNSSVVIGGTVAGLLLLLILSSAVIIALLIIKSWWRKKHHGRDSNTRMQVTEANLTHSPAHDYEAIDKYTKEYEDIVEMDLTKCPAYEPIKQT